MNKPSWKASLLDAIYGAYYVQFKIKHAKLNAKKVVIVSYHIILEIYIYYYYWITVSTKCDQTL
jgi:hypothetical protein